MAQEEAATNECEFRLQSRQNSPGRPSKPGSYRDIEERTGIDKDTIRKAEQHVAAIEAHPEVVEEEEELSQQFRGNLPRNSQGGRPVKPGSYRDIEERTGIDKDREEQLRSKLERNSGSGRPPASGSLRDASQRIGIPHRRLGPRCTVYRGRSPSSECVRSPALSKEGHVL